MNQKSQSKDNPEKATLHPQSLYTEGNKEDEQSSSSEQRSRRKSFLRTILRLRKVSLRIRLVVGLILLSTVGFSVADVIVYSQTESFLTRQVDAELAAARQPVERYFGDGGFGSPDLRAAPTGTYGEVIGINGKVISAFPAADGPGPVVPISIVKNVIRQFNSINDVSIFSAAAKKGSSTITSYRVMAIPAINGFTQELAGVEIIAIPLDPFYDTLRHLRLFDLAVGVSVLVVLTILSYVLVRVGMKPLEEIEKTADAIAKGDLSRRVTLAEPTTELGRLGLSLNTMLSQIEHAFHEQQSSENRLRQFLADASHELRTPLTSIRGYAELFRRGANKHPEDLERSMLRIESEAKRMAELVEDLLLLARLDQGHVYNFDTVDLNQIAADVVVDAQVMDPDREITFSSEGQVNVCGDEASLRQVAVNLVRNAIVHTPSTASIHINVKNSDGKGIFEVIDEGPGIATEHLEKVFERFYKADSSRNRDKGGTGLGLAIVASIVEAHHGKTGVNSVLGVGTHFWVEIPSKKTDSEQNHSSTH